MALAYEVTRPQTLSPADTSEWRVVLTHDWLVSYGGAEHCLDELLHLFPHASLHVSVLDQNQVPNRYHHAVPTLLQLIPGASTHHTWLLPLMPLAWRLRPPIDDVDVVISSSYACAKAARVSAGIPHLCYCHTPMRYAWNFDSERGRLPSAFRAPASLAMAAMRRWDRGSSANVTEFLANSTAVARRIERAYRRTAEVVHPPVNTEFYTPGGEREDFYLYVGRLVSYKRADLAVGAFADLPRTKLMVVGRGPLEASLRRRATPNVEFRGVVSDHELRDLYRRARGLVYPAEEDFGIVMAEAQACGTPVIGLAAGGALDIVAPGETGWLISDPSLASIRAAVRVASEERLDERHIRQSALRFSTGRFREGILAAVRRVLA